MQKLLLAAVILMALATTSGLVKAVAPADVDSLEWDRIYAGP